MIERRSLEWRDAPFVAGGEVCGESAASSGKVAALVPTRDFRPKPGVKSVRWLASES